MISIQDREIFWKLSNHLKQAQEKYGADNILGIFSLDKEKSEVVYIPTFEQLCLNMSTIEENIDEKISVVDVRLIYKATEHGHPELIDQLYTDYYLINPKYEHLYFKILRDNRDRIRAGITGKPAQVLKLGIVKIMRLAMNENSNAVKFIKRLTDAEKTALEHLVNEIGDEGNFCQAKLAERAGVSKVTMTNLIRKMEECQVADIKRQGCHGTYYKIIDDTLLNIRGN